MRGPRALPGVPGSGGRGSRAGGGRGGPSGPVPNSRRYRPAAPGMKAAPIVPVRLDAHGARDGGGPRLCPRGTGKLQGSWRRHNGPRSPRDRPVPGRRALGCSAGPAAPSGRSLRLPRSPPRVSPASCPPRPGAAAGLEVVWGRMAPGAPPLRPADRPKASGLWVLIWVFFDCFLFFPFCFALKFLRKASIFYGCE